MAGEPGGGRLIASLLPEDAVRAEISGQRLKQVVRPVLRDLLVRLLRIEGGTTQIVVAQSGRDFVASMAITVGAPTNRSRRLWRDAQTIRSAATSG